MKNYFVQVMVTTVDVIRELDSREDYRQIGNIENIEGATIFMSNGSSIKVDEIDNSILLSYVNPNNGIQSSTNIMWADYLRDAEKVIKGLLKDVREKEINNTRNIGEKIKVILINGLNLEPRDLLECEEPGILRFINGNDEVRFAIYNDSTLSITTNFYHVEVPLSKIDGPDTLIEEVVKPYLSAYNFFYK